MAARERMDENLNLVGVVFWVGNMFASHLWVWFLSSNANLRSSANELFHE